MRKLIDFLASLNPLVYMPNTVSAAIEGGAILWARIGFTHVGIAIPYRYTQLISRDVHRRLPLPLLRVDLWAHTCQMDQRMIFRLTVLGVSIGYLSTGDVGTPAFSDRPRGFVLGWRSSL